MDEKWWKVRDNEGNCFSQLVLDRLLSFGDRKIYDVETVITCSLAYTSAISLVTINPHCDHYLSQNSNYTYMHICTVKSNP